MALTASTWVPVGRAGLDQAIDTTSTTQTYKTGTVVRCRDMSSQDRGEAEFMYAKGVASVVAGDLCAIYPGGTAAVRATTRTIAAHLGVAQAAIVASNWGWFQIKGRSIVSAGTVVADTVPYTCATAGSVDDAVVAGDIIYGARIMGATDTSQCLIELNYPHTQDTDNA